jgi:hypothetical protein
MCRLAKRKLIRRPAQSLATPATSTCPSFSPSICPHHVTLPHAAGAHRLVQRQRDRRRRCVAVLGEVGDHALSRYAEALGGGGDDALVRLPESVPVRQKARFNATRRGGKPPNEASTLNPNPKTLKWHEGPRPAQRSATSRAHCSRSIHGFGAR